MPRLSRLRRLVPLLCLLLLVVGTPVATSAEGGPAARLRPGGAAFWDSDAALDVATSACPRACQDFRLDLLGSGARLRVAADSDGTRSPTVELYDASGARLATASGIYSAEAYLDAPRAGRYVVRVLNGSSRGTFRLRAKLERTLPPAPRGLLLPNLQLVPPYEFTMAAPGPGGHDFGCNAYERAEYGARRCLRFSLGPANVGKGPLLLEFPAMSGIAAAEPVFQLIRHADGRLLRRQAGTALYHKTHAHHHHNGFGSLELLRVTDPRRGTMTRAGVGPKQGFCMLDFMIADWRGFANGRAGAERQDCGFASGPTATQIGLGTGWADIYVYGLDGNYVEFGDNPDGRYVVRSVADANNDVLETDESDNAGYAYIDVRGQTIKVLERGHGTGPWDPRKRLADDILRPTV